MKSIFLTTVKFENLTWEFCICWFRDAWGWLRQLYHHVTDLMM